jgi:serine/threonine protein kinase
VNIDPLPPGASLFPAGAAATAATSYVIRRVLGTGGFGITYLAEWLGSEVAIKEYLPEDFAGRGADGVGVVPRTGKSHELFQFGLERFEEEARTLLQLKDAPSIARALNYFEANGTAYLVMDYVFGRTLEQLVRERGALPEGELRRLLLLTLQSLAVVHLRGYLHRDIKPSNIIVLADGRPLLIDFGAARQALGAKTQLLTVMLSPGFAPFEQYNTSGSGPFTDLYSLGATLYYCLLGGDRQKVTLTMSRAQAPDRVAALQRGEPDPLAPAVQTGAGRYSEPFLEVLDWMLRIWPAERPQAAAEVIARLEQPATRGTEMPRTLVSPKVHAAKSSALRISPRQWLAGVAALVILVTALSVVNHSDQPATRESVSTSAPATTPPVVATATAPPSDPAPVATAPALPKVENPVPAPVTATSSAAQPDPALTAAAPALPVANPAAPPSVAASTATARALALPSTPAVLNSAQLEAQLVRYDLFDRRRNPSSKGVANGYRQQVLGDVVVVSDSATQLMWQKRPASTDQYTFPAAAAHIEALNRERFGGYDDWRLPTAAEAASLLEPEPVAERYLDAVFTGGNFIWTVDTAVAGERAWVIYFYDGYAAIEPFAFNASVRAVRSLR